MENALLRDDAADQERDQHHDRHRAPAHLLQMMHGGGQAETAGTNEHMAGRCQHRAEHLDQSDQGAADAGHAAADLLQHARDRHRTGLDDGLGFDPAHLVDEAGIIRRQAGDLGLDAAIGQAAAQPFDQPGAERIEFRHLRDVDEDVGAAAAKLFGIGHHLLEHRGKAGRPRTGSAQRKPVALGYPLQCRVAAHDARPLAGSLVDAKGMIRHAALPCRICP